MIRQVTPVEIAQLLAALPSKQSTRISIARVVGEFVIPEEANANGFVKYRNLCELGGFDVSGPIAIADMLARVGAGEYRVSAYGFDPRGLRWEAFVRLGEEPLRDWTSSQSARGLAWLFPTCRHLALLLTWLWLSSMSLLLAAEINEVISEIRRDREATTSSS